MAKPLILVDPLPRTLALICDADTRARLERLGRLVVSEDRQMSDEDVDRLLPDTEIIIGQTAMPRERLVRARRLKAIFNVETNFLPNVDYQACQERGVWVLSPSASFAQAVAESALAMAIDPRARHHDGRPRVPGRHGEIRAGRQRRLLPLCRRAGRADRLRRSRPYLARAARAVPQSGDGLRPPGCPMT